MGAEGGGEGRTPTAISIRCGHLVSASSSRCGTQIRLWSFVRSTHAAAELAISDEIQPTPIDKIELTPIVLGKQLHEGQGLEFITPEHSSTVNDVALGARGTGHWATMPVVENGSASCGIVCCC